MSRVASRFSGTSRPLVIDLAGLGGCGLVVYGAWLIYQPAAFIIAGGILVAIAGVLASGQRGG